jgi:hypothetical protein
MSVRAERKTEKYFYGIIGSIILLILGILQWSFNDNLTLIRTDLTSIKAFVATGSVADATQMMEISTLKQRIGDIEQELLRGRR